VVTTNLRLYDFDLRLSSGDKNGHSSKRLQPISYRVEFKYLEEQAEQNAKRAAKQAAEARIDSKTAPRNWNYSMQVGDESQGIAPTMAYDDGRFTYLKFPNNRDFPSVFLVAEDKTESIVNKHIDPNIPDVMVIHRVAREFALRLGNAVVGIYNESYDPDGIPATEGTTVPGVKRILKTKENTNG
jgi:type IV secretion system protein VirB9